MNKILRLCCLIALSILPFSAVKSQANLLSGKKIGVYISSKAVTYGQPYYLPIAQFVTQEDDAAWNGKLKSEFLISLGWMFCQQLQPLAEADSIYFMNADLPLGRAIQEAYDPILGSISKGNTVLDELDFVLVLDEFTLETRNHRSVYIRSNRMITEDIPIKTVASRMSLFDLKSPDFVIRTSVCLDDQTSPAPQGWHFDMLRSSSPLGKFLSKVFSTWWDLMLSGERSTCGE
ncbi:MAG: hypothetical protein NWR72_02325 [Bacteroidia bacterium]|nr:hypothetical protein [Bacteroidia bacterium]